MQVEHARAALGIAEPEPRGIRREGETPQTGSAPILEGVVLHGEGVEGHDVDPTARAEERKSTTGSVEREADRGRSREPWR